jgi:hypothetical protein
MKKNNMKRQKNCYSLLAAIRRAFFAGILMIFSLSFVIQPAQAQFAGGTGTETDPWQVATAEHLNEVRNHRADHFLQIADIDLSDAGEFIPLAASRENNFLGTYDGGGHVVSNLTVRLGGSNNGQALFGFLGDTGVIRNLGVVNADVIGGSNTAALVGRNEGGLVRNCWSTGTVRSEAGAHVNTGGLVGFMLNGALVENSHSIVDVSTTGRRAGGLVGTNDGATISNSYATGTVISEREADNAWSGGLVGEAIGDAQVIGSWASVVVDAHLIGGFAGAAAASVELTQNYWDVEASGISEAMAGGDADVSDVTGLQTDQMQGQAAYSNMPGLDFEQVWHLTQDYPALQWEDVDALPIPAEPGPARRSSTTPPIRPLKWSTSTSTAACSSTAWLSAPPLRSWTCRPTRRCSSKSIPMAPTLRPPTPPSPLRAPSSPRAAPSR